MKNRKILAGPYLFWAMSFIIIPLLMILYYGLTDKNGSFTLNNLSQMTTPENLKALGLALLLSFISTLICLVLLPPPKRLHCPAPAEAQWKQRWSRS